MAAPQNVLGAIPAYLRSATGEVYQISGPAGPPAPTEVYIDTVEPVGTTTDILWADESNLGLGGTAGPIALDDLTDVDTVTVAPVSGNVLSFDGTTWKPGAGGGVAPSSGIPVFADAAARDLAIPTPTAGAFAWLNSTSKLTVFQATLWRNLIGPNYGGATIGDGTVSQPSNVAIGQGQATGTSGAVSIGYLSAAGGPYSTALGWSSRSNGNSSIALGPAASAGHLSAVAIGHGATTAADLDFVLGKATHHVKIPGTLTVAGVPVSTRTETDSLRAEIADLRSQIEELKSHRRGRR